MTLQQKLRSKKGFTLVELVVVIAILAILAAIAIPAVIGIINSANESQKSSDAATVDNACKTWYAGVVAGSITQADATGAAPAGAANSARKSYALTSTVQNALEYNKTWTSLSGKLADFGCDKDGNIYSNTDAAHSTGLTHKALTGSVKMGQLYAGEAWT